MNRGVVHRLNEFASSDSDDEEVVHAPSNLPAPSVSHTSGEFNFFDDVHDGSGTNVAERAKIDGRARARAPDAARRVGRGLLAGMHCSGVKRERDECIGERRSTSQSAIDTSAWTRNASNGREGALRVQSVVTSYAPLTSGGFMDASAEHANVQSIKIGDVVCLRSENMHSHNNNNSNNKSSSTSANNRSSYGKTLAVSSVGASTECTGLARFRKESDLSAEERRYGKAVTYEMLHELGEVTRLDKLAQVVEVTHLDGIRAKHSLYHIRPAGYVEQTLYRQWKHDSRSRPIQVIKAQGASESSSSAAKQAETAAHHAERRTIAGSICGTNRPEEGPQQGDMRACHTEAAAASTLRVPSTSAPVWWVIPRLVVRIIDTSALDWYGKQCVVRVVRRKESAIRLVEYCTESEESNILDDSYDCNSNDTRSRATNESNAVLSSLVSVPPAARKDGREVEMVGQDGLATVVPRVGQTGLVVRGVHRGEQVMVTQGDGGGGSSTYMCSSNHRNMRETAADLVATDSSTDGRDAKEVVHVLLCRTGQTIRLSTDEVCVVAKA